MRPTDTALSGSERRNVVLISVDSLRADFCPWLGYDGIDTPTLEAVSSRGVSFENAVAPGQATPDSMPQIFTGYPRPEGRAVDGSIEDLVLAHRTIPGMLREAGYETIGFTSNPYTSRMFGFDGGFDHFEDFIDRDEGTLGSVRSWVRSNPDSTPAQAVRLLLNVVNRGDLTVAWRDYYEEVLSRVRRAEEPFFLWIFLMEPHLPYIPSSAHRDGLSLLDFLSNTKQGKALDWEMTDRDRRSLIRLYERTILDVDDFVHAIRNDLEAYDPAYVFHSDHGESFGEHGNWGHEGYLHDENVRVPLEIWNVDTTEDVSEPVSLRRMPEMVAAAARDGGPESWTAFTEPYVTSRLDDTVCGLYGDGWTYYPAGGVGAPEGMDDLCERLCEAANVRNAEYGRLRAAADDVVDGLE